MNIKSRSEFLGGWKACRLHVLRKEPFGCRSFSEFARRIQEAFRELGIGIVRFESMNLEQGLFILTVYEDLDCSGLSKVGYGACTYDEGLISGLLESFAGSAYKVTEVDCWGAGDRTCRIMALKVV